jgi:hypothetical protein
MKVQESPVTHAEPSAEHFQELDRAAYEAAIASAREAGYRQGFQDGFLTNFKAQCGATVPVPKVEAEPVAAEVAANGRPLVGLPCVKCGRSYPASMSNCPRCNHPAEIPVS